MELKGLCRTIPSMGVEADLLSGTYTSVYDTFDAIRYSHPAVKEINGGSSDLVLW